MGEKDYYEKEIHWKTGLPLGEMDDKRYRVIMEMLPKGIGSMLDVGCGNGTFLNLARSTGFAGIGLERSRVAGRIARQTFDLPIINGEIERLPFADRTFDAVLALEVLEHLTHGAYKLALEELSRVSRRLIIVNVPFKEKRVFIVCPECGTRFNPSYHNRTFNEGQFKDLFPGFSLQESLTIRLNDIYLDRYAGLIKSYNAVAHPELHGHYPLTMAQCPVCEFELIPDKQPAATTAPPPPRPSAFRKKLSQLVKKLPQPRYREIIAMYARNEDV